MNKIISKKIIIYFVIVLFIFLADRFSKLYILSVLQDYHKVITSDENHKKILFLTQ